ncbi:hypothetical protein P7C70_g7326, partial [Phenoliferia sp. Uapishka_3]
MGRKPSGFVGAKGKAKGSASSSPHAGRLEPCRTCNREFKPGAAYENHSRKCRSDLGKSEWQDTEWARELRVGLTRPDPSHAAKEQAGVRLQASVAAMTARLAGLDASPDHETDGRRELGPGSDDEEHWSDYNNDFGGNADDDLGGHQEFSVDGAAAESAAGSAATDDESDSDDSEVVGEEDHHQGPRVMNPALVEYRIINGVRLECHLPASTLDHTGWKNTRPLPAPPAQPPVPPKSKSREKQNVADVEPDSPNGEGDTGIDGDGTNPWHPFQTWTDFKITKMLKDLGASGAKIDDFLGVLNDDRFKVEEMHIRSAKKMEACLAYGRSLARAPWRSEDIVIAKEDGMDAKFTIWSRSIKEIVQELLGRPEVAKHMNWVPRKYYQTDAEGQKQRVYHDFDSGDYFHELHSSVKVGDYIIFLHLYADASKIATFGGNKVWPVRFIKMYPTFVGLRTFSDFTGKPWVDATYYRALHAVSPLATLSHSPVAQLIRTTVQVLLFIAPGTLGDHEHHLLKLIRYWAIMHQYDGLHIQTKQTLASMQVVVSRIELLMKRVAQLCRKSIDYPKFHNLGKVVARMKLLGVGKFTSTRVGEELHRDDHAFYKTSNKRDVTEQLVKQHESKAIMQLIEGKAQRLFLETHPPPLPRQKPRVVVGSDDKTEKRWSFSHFLEQQREEDAYNNFTLKIRTLLYDPAGALPNARPRMALMPPISDCTISTYHLLHIQYPRIDNWEDGHDLARCHEVFGEKKRPRYDSVMYNPQHIINSPHDPDDTDLSFGRLVSIFKLTGPDGVAHRPMALVQNFVVDGRDVATWSLVGEEVERINCSVIWVDSIVRACHTPPKPEDDMQRLTKKNALNPQHEKGAYYINEFIDRDMYFRLKYALNVDTGDLEEKYFELVASENDSFMEDSDEEDLEVLGLEGEEEEGINEGAEDF